MQPTFERIQAGELALAQAMFALLARVFDEPHEVLEEDYLNRLLNDQLFWAIAALDEHDVVGGLTAWALPMTSKPEHELLVYDLAIDPTHWRQGYGRRLIESLLRQAADCAIKVAWVPVDNEDTHALDFYRSLHGEAMPSTIFNFVG